MTRQGKYNLLGIILLPLAVILAAAISTMNGVWEAYAKTYVFLFGLNFGLMLAIGFFCGLPLLWIIGEKARWLLVLPAVTTAGFGGIWYLWSAIFPSTIAPGWQFIGVPQYLATGLFVAILFFLVALIVLLLRIFGVIPKPA